MTQTLKKTLGVFIGIIALLIVYWPALTGHYFYHDDVNFFFTTPNQPYPKSYHLSLAIGRFIGANVYAAHGLLINHINDLGLIRWIGFLQVIACALLSFRILRQNNWPDVIAATLALLIFTLPSFQILIAMAGYSFQLTGVLLALVSISLLSHNKCQNLLLALKGWRIWCSLLLFVLAIATHPSTAMFYWTGLVMLLVRQRFDHARPLIMKTCVLMGTGAVAMGWYALILKFIRARYSQANLGDYNPHNLTANFFDKLIWFVQEPLVNAVNLWNIFPDQRMTWSVLGFVGLTSLCLIGSHLRESINLKVIKGLLLIALVLLSFSTNLLAIIDAPFYRCCLALSSTTLCLLFASGLWWIERLPHHLIFTISIVVCMLLGTSALYYSHNTLSQFRVTPSIAETRYVVDRMIDKNVFEYGRVHIYTPNRKELLNRYDEFGGPTSSFKTDRIGLVIAGIRQAAKDRYEVEHLEYDFKNKKLSMVFRDRNNEKFAFHTLITAGSRRDPIHGNLPTLILDIPSLYHDEGKLNYLRKD